MQLIDNGAHINAVNKLNNSALILAIQSGNKKQVKTVKQITEREIWKKSFFNRLEFKKTAELLIQNGADVNIVSQSGKTALIHATENGKQF